MSLYLPYGIAAPPARTAAKVAVAVITGPDALLVATPEQLGRWRRLTPLALWSTVSVRDTHPDEILHGVAAGLARPGVEAHRLILLAEGKAARAALELVLRGAIDCAGLLAIAVPCAALSSADIDARIIGFDSAAATDARAAASATETFVLELVANAGRQRPSWSMK